MDEDLAALKAEVAELKAEIQTLKIKAQAVRFSFWVLRDSLGSKDAELRTQFIANLRSAQNNCARSRDNDLADEIGRIAGDL